jgi:hypothetical protein
VIWERDVWDQWLIGVSESEESWISMMAAFAQLGVWFSRKILTGLLMVGHLFSCYLSRRMEFHADQFEIRLAGSEAFESVCERLTLLQTLHQDGLEQMGMTWNMQKRLPDNLPQFILNMEAGQMGAHVRKALKGHLGFVTTGLFHTHPSDAERVRAARLAHEPGIVTIDAPATDLFENFPVPARIVTTLFYQGAELPLGLAKIYEVEMPQPGTDQGNSADRVEEIPANAVERYFLGIVTPLRPIFPRTAKIADADIAETIGNIEGLPAQINAVAEQIAEACANFDQADRMMLTAAQEDNGFAECIDVAGWRAQRDESSRALHSVLDALEKRIEMALGLAATERFGEVSAAAPQLRQRITAGLKNLERLQPVLRAADSLRVNTAMLLRRGPAHAMAVARLREEMADLEAALREVPCPAEFAKAASLYEYYKAMPASQEPVLPPRAEALARLPMAAYTRVLGELVLVAEEIVATLNAPERAPVEAA